MAAVDCKHGAHSAVSPSCSRSYLVARGAPPPPCCVIAILIPNNTTDYMQWLRALLAVSIHARCCAHLEHVSKYGKQHQAAASLRGFD